jgi:hypothetical protein
MYLAVSLDGAGVGGVGAGDGAGPVVNGGAAGAAREIRARVGPSRAARVLCRCLLVAWGAGKIAHMSATFHTHKG